MFTVIGIVVVLGAVLGGFTIAGGQIPSLFHISEIIVICGTSAGTVVISTPLPVLKKLVSDQLSLLKPNPFTQTLYLDTLKMLFELFQIAQRDGLVAIESHIEDPDKSSLFQKYPKLLEQHHAIDYLCDSLRIVLMGSVPPHDLDMMMELDIEVHHEESEQTVVVLQRVADGLPGIGIVAAVLGIIITMAHINGSIEQIGAHVAAALTGTMLGVLLAYGFVSPMANALQSLKSSESRFYFFLKAAVISLAKGSSPMIAVEFARRAVSSDVRPSFAELEEACQSVKKSAKAA